MINCLYQAVCTCTVHNDVYTVHVYSTVYYSSYLVKVLTHGDTVGPHIILHVYLLQELVSHHL